MATTQVSQQLSAVAGMVTNPMNPVAKAAQKHLVGVIQAKSQIERQAAIRKAVARQARDTRMPPSNQQHGKHIWIYNMKGTNRVVYSLTREINDTKALAQLTYVGKKSVPSHIRPDVWNPLAIVTFPTAVQGLEAFRILREFRMRHEYEWRQHLDDKNDLPTKRKRIRMLQNQKPNTIADLAATLALQHRLGKAQFEERLEQLRQNEEKYQAILLQLRDIEAKLAKAEATNSGETALSHSNLVLERQRLETPAFTQLSRYHTAAEHAREAASKEADLRGLSSSAATEGEQSPRDAFIQHRQLELLPRCLAELRNYPPLPKRGAIRQTMIRELVPTRQHIPTLNGVKIMWADGNDRNYAEEWPAAVEHEAMGIFNRTAPHPDRLRDLSQLREETPELVATFDARQDALALRTTAQWSEDSEDLGKFRQYLIVRRQLVRQRVAEFARRARKGEPREQEDQASLFDLTAANRTIAAFDLIARLLSEDKQGRQKDTLKSVKNRGRSPEKLEFKARSLLLEAAKSRMQAQVIRIEAAKEANAYTPAMGEQLQKLEQAVSDTAAASASAGLVMPHQLRKLKTFQKRVKKGIVLSNEDQRWYEDALLAKKERDAALLAKREQESNLTAEEEEMLKNVELDGESSGKNEEDADEAEAQDKEEGLAKEEGERRELEKEEKRQHEERKSLWGRLFSGSSSSSSKDNHPRTSG